MKIIFFLLIQMSLFGCAIMHHTQVGEVDSQVVLKGERFEVLVSEIGFNVGEIGSLAKATTNHAKTNQDIANVQAIIQMFQMGPKTGNPVLDDAYSDDIFFKLKEKCPAGVISGLVSIRETAKYPLVSGEIVKVTGYCYSKKRG